MEVESVRAIPLEHSLSPGSAFGGTRGVTETRTATLIKLVSDDGTVGWGEAFAPPRTVAQLIDEEFAKAVIGLTPWDAESLADDVYTGTIGGYHFGRGPFVQSALTGIEVALWDLRGKLLGKPIHELLGGRSRSSVTPYASTMYITEWDQDPASPMQEAVEEEFTAAKIKIGRSVEDDRERVRIAREILGDDAPLMVDYNGNYTVSGALESIRAISEFDITWVEEPLPPEDTEGYRELGQKIDVSLAAGEAHFGRFEFTDLIRSGAIDVVQPNLGRCGGFAQAEYIAQVATTNNVKVRPHVWNSAVGVAAALQFTATVPDYPQRADLANEPTLFEFDRSENPLRDELLTDPLDPSGGTLSVPTEPGLGVEIDESAVERFAVGY
ncbi:mandelate racemase/muconate lactonizing enzyme family protein [Saliphagus sp. LR7]|uniref:mandelate racemase/muconate lactonizing enzyme family protein n=1 Tax=Saliphagus sp. LR7 TaxID=2282654 RepID=UPI000DF861A1|nr:mandelate racemase/muconate lactonizing enzyme family protein [Saliphagus sp. LR7]